MATHKKYVCSNSKCKKKSKPSRLLDALLEFSKAPPKCADCGTQTDLKLQFELGLGLGETECTVLDVFTPKHPEKWEYNGDTVRFYPFLVVLRENDGTPRVWLPYWHVVETKEGKKKKKYGQWAPFMRERYFKELLSQAREKGHDF